MRKFPESCNHLKDRMESRVVSLPYFPFSLLLHYSEKLKNAKSNYGYSYLIAPWYIKTEKTWFFKFRVFLAWGVAALNFSAPLKVREKNRSDYRVHGIQNDRLNLMVSMLKSVLKNMHRVPRYYQKTVQNRLSKPNQQNMTYFGRYIRTRCIFFKTKSRVETVSPSRSIWIPWMIFFQI